MKLGEGNVFTGVCHSIGRSLHATITHDALGHGYLPHPPPPVPHLKPDMGPTPLLLTYLVVITGNKGPTPSPLLTFGGYHWKPVQTCSFEDLPSPQPVLTSSAPCRNFSNFFLKTTRSVISVHILVLVSMRKYILNHK